MEMREKIQNALRQLDHENDTHWTDEGLPRTGVVQGFVNDTSIKRSHINEAMPGFFRKTGDAMGDPPETTGSGLPIDPQTIPAPAVDAVAATATAAAPQDAENGEEMTEDEVQELLAQNIRDAENAIEAARRKIAEGHVDERHAKERLERAKVDMQRRFPPLTEAENIKLHLQAQNEARAAQFGARGVYGGQAQIDLAMSKGNSRGWRRPNRGLINQQARG